MKEIPLTNGDISFVDDEDFDRIAAHNWYSLGRGKYARTRIGSRFVLMHRMIIEAAEAEVVDHINGNRLDNRKGNLRICTHKQNTMNVATKSKLGVKGVFKSGKNWAARIRVDGKIIYLGSHLSKEKAAFIYDQAAKKYFGEFARLNFPD